MKSTLFSDSFRFLNITRPDCSYTDCRCGSPMNFVAYMKKGNGRIVSPDITIEICEGDFFYIPKNSGYVLDTEITGDCYIINFDFVEEYEGEEFILSPKNTNEILRHFENAENMWRTRQTGYYEKTLSELYEIIYNIKKSMAPSYVPKSRAAVIEPAMKYIYENYTSENIGISDLASLCGISEQYLRQIFRSVHGVSPLKFINNLKISRAKELIKYGPYSISQVAELSGFSDNSYFCREFKKSTGVSPKEYSKS